MITGGMAARIAAAETRCQLLTNWPFRAFRPAVIGFDASPCVSTVAQK